ncbi:hypothetical protein BDR04DRAFT_1091658 [Suillus decipiens]|nr:hypothetical protein BDR04DRAFT_1091658 [Suillus decipiens]
MVAHQRQRKYEEIGMYLPNKTASFLELFQTGYSIDSSFLVSLRMVWFSIVPSEQD